MALLILFITLIASILLMGVIVDLPLQLSGIFHLPIWIVSLTILLLLSWGLSDG